MKDEFVESIEHAGAQVEFTFIPASERSASLRAVGFSLRVAPDDYLTGKAVRELPLGDLLRRARDAAESKRTREVGPLFADLERHRLSSFVGAKQGAIRNRSDAEYAELAAEYVELVAAGERRPAQALADEFGSSAKVWTNRIGEARRRGLLTETSRGRAGGALTDKAVGLLN